jgi:uncharacterized protein (TIGR03118 family)
VEPLEDRRLLSVLSATVLQTNLVSDLPGVAQIQDSNLVNPWGISESSGSPFWISDNNAGVSSLYHVPGANNTPVSIDPLVVSIPTPNDPLGATGAPTGTVFNLDLKGMGFKVNGFDANGVATSAPAIFLFVTEDGTIVGWNPGVNPKNFDPNKAGTYGIIAVDNSTNPNAADGAVYKGMTIATSNAPIFAGDSASNAVIYVANFRSGQIEVYDSNFHPVMLPTGAFSDPNLPAGYAPFNVQVLNGKVYVTYAKQNADKHDDLAGPHRGFVDVFNLDGTPGVTKPDGTVTPRLITRGPLNSPWGLAIAPASFGHLGGALLVGNFGDGHINAFDAGTGKFLAQLTDPDGEPIQIDGLWALKVGNGGQGGDANTVYFTAGLFGETHGLFGSLSAVAPGSPEGPAESQKVIAAFDVVQLDLNQVLMDIAHGATMRTVHQDLMNLQAALMQFKRAEREFVNDVRHDAAGSDGQDRAALAALDEVFEEIGKLEI